MASQMEPCARTDALSVVIPAYNEEARLPSTLIRVAEYLRGASAFGAFEVLVVDDGSRDRTAEVVQAMGERFPQIALLQYGRNRGKGYAVRHGVLQSRHPLVLLSDADLSTPIEEVEKLVPYIKEGFKAAIGSRGLKDSLIAVRQPWHRERMGRTFNLFVQALLIPGIEDTQCGFKLFEGGCARSVFERATIDGFSFDVEALFIASKLGCRIKEVPIRWLNSPASRVSVLSDPIKMFVDLLRIRRNWRRGVYNR